jgi:hypothetical protein
LKGIKEGNAEDDEDDEVHEEGHEEGHDEEHDSDSSGGWHEEESDTSSEEESDNKDTTTTTTTTAATGPHSLSTQVQENIQMKKSMGASTMLEKVYALYISTNNNDGIALNGLGQLFHDLCIGDNHLTISDLGIELPPCCFVLISLPDTHFYSCRSCCSCRFCRSCCSC